MEKKITTNQASLLLVIFTVSLKLSVLPALTCDYAGRSAYIVSFLALLVDFLFTIAVILIIRKIPEKSFFELFAINKNNCFKTCCDYNLYFSIFLFLFEISYCPPRITRLLLSDTF